MKQKFTQNLLVKYLYKETSVAETLEIRDALNEDPALFSEFNELQKGLNELPKAKFNPAPSTIQNILGYSAETAVENAI